MNITIKVMRETLIDTVVDDKYLPLLGKDYENLSVGEMNAYDNLCIELIDDLEEAYGGGQVSAIYSGDYIITEV